MHSRTAPSDLPLASPRPPLHAIVLVTGLVLLTILLWVRGAGFYDLDVQARVDHPDFRTLSPSAPIGHGYGIFGTLLIITNLSYLLRRRFARARLGSMRTWLDVHVFTGLFGSLLILFHSAFQLRSGVASMTAWSLGIVVLSGLVGRYFYAISPEPDRHAQLQALSEVRTHWPDLANHLTRALAEMPPPTGLSHPSLLRALMTCPTWLREARARRRHVRAVAAHAMDFAGLAARAPQRKQLRAPIERIAALSAAEVGSVAGSHLLRSWRGLHRFMALLMIVAVTVHIGVAWHFGFRWVLSE
ncbi:MAG: hypothetical protein OEZ06_11105 [Myxococcales bacterium]|nr:hypothetical protein [Myxococcales bacterium]